MEETSGEESIPIPKRGTYNLDFLDDNACINPFESKCKLGQSPTGNSDFDENINPFKSKSKIGHSPPQNLADNNFNPFKSSSAMRHSPVPFSNQNYNEQNGNQSENDMNNLQFDQKRYIEDEELDDNFSDPMFDYGSENAEIINKDISIATGGKDECGVALTNADRVQSFDSLEENSPQDKFTDDDFGSPCSGDSINDCNPKTYQDDDVYDDFKDAESPNESISGSNVFGSVLAETDRPLYDEGDIVGSMLTGTDRPLHNEVVQNINPLGLKEDFEECEEVDSLDGEDIKEIDEDLVKSMNNDLKGPESDPGETFPYSDVTERQSEDREISQFSQTPEVLPVPTLANEIPDEQGKLPARFDDGIHQGNLTKEEIFKEESNEFTPLNVLDNEKHKPSDDVSSTMLLSSTNLCEDSGLGDSIVTSGSEDLDKADDMKSEEGMESLPATPDALSDQNMTLSQKNDAGFEDDEDFQPDELMPELYQAQSADNGEELFSENNFENACTALENSKLNTAHDLDLISQIECKSDSSLKEPEAEYLKELTCREQCGEFEKNREKWEGFSGEQQGEVEKSIDNNCQSAFEENTVLKKDLEEIQAENVIGNIQNGEQESLLPSCNPEKQVDSQGLIAGLAQLYPALNFSNSEESITAEELAELKNILDSLKNNETLHEYNFPPDIEKLLGLSMDTVPKEAIGDDIEFDDPSETAFTTKCTAISDFDKMGDILGLNTGADDLDSESLEDSENMQTVVGCGDDCIDTNFESRSELNHDYEHLMQLSSEDASKSNRENYSHAYDETVSQNEIDATAYMGENLGDELQFGEFNADELFNTMSKNESLSENKIQDISKLFNQDTEIGDPSMATVASDIAHSIGNRIGLKASGSCEEKISLSDLSPNKSVESVDKLFNKSKDNTQDSVLSAEMSQMSVFGALVVGSQLIASAVLGPSAVCPPALKSPYFNFPLHELGLPDNYPHTDKPPSPQTSLPAASHVSFGNEQVGVDAESSKNGSVLHPLTTKLEEFNSQPSSEFLGLGPQSKESSAVENGAAVAAASQSKDCASAPPMRVTSISAEETLLEDG